MADNAEVKGLYLADVVHDVIADFAPEELPLLAALRRFDDAEAGRRLARGNRRDDPLGFGMGEIVALATPAVYIAVRQVADRVTGTVTDGMFARIRVLVRRRRRRVEPAVPLPHFSPADIREVHDRVKELAVKGGMKPARAEQLADQVIGRLTLDGYTGDAT